MTADEVKTALGKAARRCWPEVTKASDLPYPEYWKAVTEWLTFHAPHVGDALMRQYIDDVVTEAVLAEAAGKTPKARTVPDKVREIWANVTEHSSAIRTASAAPAPQPATKPPSPFGAPFSGPKPGALKKAQRMMEQGSLGSW